MKGRGILARVALALVAIGVVAVIPSCISTSYLPVPERSAVGQLVVSRPSADGATRELVIEDAQTIERLLNFLRAHNGDWRKPWDTFPIPRYMVSQSRQGTALGGLVG